ncbi:phosphoenolpyruvate synthase [Patescibacteria group bacterium]|nr:phosphoenolpyruvate synthase [Patescibacteria group bacterium]
MNSKGIYWFEQIGKEDTEKVGGKGANLGEMTTAGFPVPPGFIVGAECYLEFLKENKLDQKIKETLSGLNTANPVELAEASNKIKHLIKTTPVPQPISEAIIQNYLHLGKIMRNGSRLGKFLRGLKDANLAVAIRSSATSEDSKTASFAGQNETYLNIVGEANVVDAVRACWASLFDGRSIFYRQQQHISQAAAAIAVVVQAQIPSEVSGIVFSIDPVTNNRQRVVIESIWGLGEYVVQGKVTPDHYEVNKNDLYITDRQQVVQTIQLSRISGGRTKETKVPGRLKNKRKLSDEQVTELAKLSLNLEKHYYFPQDSEFAVAGGKIYLVQTRPITTTQETGNRTSDTKEEEKFLEKMEILLTGAPASPGIKSGPAKVLKSAKEIDKIMPGDVLVATQTNPDYVPAMKKACAIVTDKGGRTSHAAIVSRELGIPCVVGTESATRLLKTGEVVTVNGAEGKVYKGGIKIVTKVTEVTKVKTENRELKTATKVYVNLAEPDKAKEIAAKNCDGVGLLRAEFMLAGIGIHPKKAIADRKQNVFIEGLTEQLTTFVQAFYPRPVVYRATDFKTNEYRSLKGGEAYEPHEENPMIGFRGAYRYIVQPEVFKMEIEAIKNVREKLEFRNLWLMIPFCRTVKELEQVKQILSDNGLRRSPSFRLWMMCEIPSNVILLDKFLEAGIDGISVGSNDLTMLTLGVDRDNENVASEYDERNEAMYLSFEKIIKTCKKYDVTCSMCGQAPSDYPELTEKLVEWGITSVSVNPDVIDHTRQVVYEAERKLISKR